MPPATPSPSPSPPPPPPLAAGPVVADLLNTLLAATTSEARPPQLPPPQPLSPPPVPPSQPPVVDLSSPPMSPATLSSSDSQSDDDVTLVAPAAPHLPAASAPSHSPTVSSSSDIVEVVSTRAAAAPMVVDLDDDDAVDYHHNAAFQTPPFATAAASVAVAVNSSHVIDVESDASVIPDPHPAPAPHPLPPASTQSSSSDVVECTAPPRRPRSRRTPSVCPACSSPHRSTPASLRLSRCKHALCSRCSLRAIADLIMSAVDADADADADPDPEDSPRAIALLPVPVCPVPRCRAPLSVAEVDTALAPPHVDAAFAHAREVFHTWRQASPDHIGGSAASAAAHAIEFPGFSPEHTAFPLPGGIIDGLEVLTSDDIATACEPLWVFDSDNGYSRGAWVCAACGLYDTSRQSIDVFALTSSPEGSDVVSEVEDVPEVRAPPIPPYPHCAHARALGVWEHVKGLSLVWEDEKDAAKRKNQEAKAAAGSGPASAVGKRTASRKRYKSASSIRSVKRRKVGSAKKGGFAKGTGYAGSSGTEWKGTSEKLLAEAYQRDFEATFWLVRLRCFLLRTNDAQLASWPGFMRSLLRECGLVSHLAKILINDSIMEVLNRIPVYYAALRVVHALADSPSMRMLVTEPSDGDNGRSLAELAESLSRQAAFLTTGAGPEGVAESTSFFIKQIRKVIRVINRNNLLQVVKNRNVAYSFVDVDDVENSKPDTDMQTGALSSVEMETVKAVDTVGLPPVTEVCFEADKALYIKKMKAHQFAAVPGLASSSTFFQEAQRADMTGTPLGRRQRRISSEVASLFSSLPLSWSSTILLRVDEDRYDFLRACIFGPEDTPYDSGAFVFDIYLPHAYPDVPPKFRLLTTGGGKVRFNPNLYSNGKVCLSLLGTWSGPSWTATSTILQVLVSIQSLILVPDPYFNEPGFERNCGTEAGRRASSHYNARARLDSALHAILANVRHPTPELVAGMRAHFRLKRRYLVHKLREWFPHATQQAPSSQPPPPQEETPSLTVAMSHPLALTADPLASLFTQASSSGMPSTVVTPSFSFSSFGPGRHFRSPEMTATNLQKIIAELDGLQE